MIAETRMKFCGGGFVVQRVLALVEHVYIYIFIQEVLEVEDDTSVAFFVAFGVSWVPPGSRGSQRYVRVGFRFVALVEGTR